MDLKQNRYDSAIGRLIAETSNAIIKRRVLSGFSKARSFHGLDFFRIAKHSISNDVISHAIRIFDQHRDVASLWYVIQCDEKIANCALKKIELNLSELRELSEKVRTIRDKTHFHIDKKFVDNPALVWKAAAITESDLDRGFINTFKLIAEINRIRTGSVVEIPDYDGSDVVEIIKAFQLSHPESVFLA